MADVFLLHHTYGESERETYKLLGVFSSREAADEHVKLARKLPGFKSYPEGFTISRYVIDEVCWAEGFGFDEIDDVEE